MKFLKHLNYVIAGTLFFLILFFLLHERYGLDAERFSSSQATFCTADGYLLHG
jgi:hypothetical protein